MMRINDPSMNMSPIRAKRRPRPRSRAAPSAFPAGQSPLPGLDPNLTDRFGTPYEPRPGGAPDDVPGSIEEDENDAEPAKVMTGGGEGGN